MTPTIFEREKFFSILIWLFPIVYVFHIIEESNGFAYWVTNVLGGQMTLKPFLINNSIFMIVLLSLCFISRRQKKVWSTFLLFFWTSAQEFWNFIFHIYTTIQFHAYSPGYFTAILLYLPVYFYLSYICLREKFLTWQLWLTAFILSSTAMAFTIWAGLYHFRNIPWEKWIP